MIRADVRPRHTRDALNLPREELIAIENAARLAVETGAPVPAEFVVELATGECHPMREDMTQPPNAPGHAIDGDVDRHDSQDEVVRNALDRLEGLAEMLGRRRQMVLEQARRRAAAREGREIAERDRQAEAGHEHQQLARHGI